MRLVQPSSGVIAAFVPTIFSFRQRAIILRRGVYSSILSLRHWLKSAFQIDKLRVGLFLVSDGA
jgi:hypothetical protein